MKHTLIIGGGLGGLFTAALLSKEGMKVTVIEKNAILGGGLQSFRRFGEVYDAGMHIIGGMQPGGSIYRICRYLGILEEMHLRPVDDDCMDEIFFGGDATSYRIRKGREGFAESLAEYFPHQREALIRYVDALYEMSEEFDLFYLRPQRANIFMHSPDFSIPVGEFIAKYIDDERLMALLAYMNPLYGGEKDKTPAYVHAIINVLYINGGSRFEGGCYRFVDVLRRFILSHGGEIVTGDGVVKVSSEGKTITSVTTQSGKTFTADNFISAIHPCTFLRLIDDNKLLPKAYRKRLEDLPNSYSAFTLFLKLKPLSVRYVNHMRYYFTDYDRVWDMAAQGERWPEGVMSMTLPEINQGEYATKMIITTPMMWEEVQLWEDTTVGKRGADYEAWKMRRAQKMIDTIERHHPGFSANIEHINTASPLTIRDYYGVKKGAMYGYVHDCHNLVQSQIPVVTKVTNLFLTGQNMNLHGFCGVSLTAIQTCEAILGTNYLINRIG